MVALLAGLALAGAAVVIDQRDRQETSGTLHTPLSGEAEWEGDWEISERGADPSQAGSQAGTDRVTIPFTGTDFALRVRRGGYRTYFWVSVDGEPANRLPRTERGAYLVLSSPDYEPRVETIPVASGLNDGPHTAEIVADRGWDQWPLVGWEVSRKPDTTLCDRILPGLAAAAALCLIGIAWWGSRETAKEERREESAPAYSVPPALCSTQYAIRNTSYVSHLPPLALLIAATAFYLSPWPPLTLVSGLALAVLVLLRLDLGLALVALAAPFYLHPRPLLGKSFSMAEIALLLCLASWIVRQIGKRYVWQSEKREAGSRKQGARNLLPPASCIFPPPSSLDSAALAFALVAGVSTLLAADFRHVALRELRVVVIEPLLLYLMLSTTKLDEEAVWRIVDGFVLGAVTVALVGLAQYILDINVITAEQGFRRLRSIYGSPNNAALYLGRALPMLLAVLLFGRTRRRAFYGTGAVAVGVAILLTFSRGAILLGVPISLLAMGVLAGGRWRWFSLGAIALAALGLIPLMRTPRFAGMLDPHSGTLFFRLQLWRAAWKMFREHPWLGVAPDNFLYQYRGRYILPGAWQEPHLSHAHNVVLSYATRLGILGLLVGTWLQTAFWRSALPFRRLKNKSRHALALGLMGSMANFLAHGLVDASYFFPDLAFTFFLTLGLVQWLRRAKCKA